MQSPIVHCPYPHHRLVQPEGLDWSMILSTKPCLYWMTHIEVSIGFLWGHPQIQNQTILVLKPMVTRRSPTLTNLHILHRSTTRALGMAHLALFSLLSILLHRNLWSLGSPLCPPVCSRKFEAEGPLHQTDPHHITMVQGHLVGGCA